MDITEKEKKQPFPSVIWNCRNITVTDKPSLELGQNCI
jgi:hypothetical protein